MIDLKIWARLLSEHMKDCRRHQSCELFSDLELEFSWKTSRFALRIPAVCVIMQSRTVFRIQVMFFFGFRGRLFFVLEKGCSMSQIAPRYRIWIKLKVFEWNLKGFNSESSWNYIFYRISSCTAFLSNFLLHHTHRSSNFLTYHWINHARKQPSKECSSDPGFRKGAMQFFPVLSPRISRKAAYNRLTPWWNRSQ